MAIFYIPYTKSEIEARKQVYIHNICISSEKHIWVKLDIIRLLVAQY